MQVGHACSIKGRFKCLGLRAICIGNRNRDVRFLGLHVFAKLAATALALHDFPGACTRCSHIYLPP